MIAPVPPLRSLGIALAVCRLSPTAATEPWMQQGPLWSITRTPDELSVICDLSRVPAGVQREGPFSAFVVEGPLDFGLTGIVSSLTHPLAEARIAVLVMATFDTDYLLIREPDVARAVEAWMAAGVTVTGHIA